MNQDALKTSTKQRIIIAIIAIVMLGSIIASYAAIVIAGNGSSKKTGQTAENELVEKAQREYDAAANEIYSNQDYFNEFVAMKNNVVAFNEVSANENGLVAKDLKVGSGRELADGDLNYVAFYIGFCADESIFDSSLNSTSNPTAFKSGLDVASIGSLIEGWNLGVVGMKLGGIREVTIPGELAYGDAMEICGGRNKPLKFIIMAVDQTEKLNLARTKLQYAQMGIDYDNLNVQSGAEE
jgi:FKBP-type peptidyl-prolyl cis-trans isomerase